MSETGSMLISTENELIEGDAEDFPLNIQKMLTAVMEVNHCRN